MTNATPSTAANTQADAARISPATEFEKPEDVVTDAQLTPQQKEKVLDQWQADAEALQTATGEGMAPGPADLSDTELDDVNEAKSKIENSDV
ncbi:MAG: hypothetical protein IKE66_12495 [Hyphomicrobium sp.]|nr:hypothetical protein [Hyphomicrobium sp.]